MAWHLSLVPALVAAGYRVATFDNRGVEPSSSPPAPYSVDGMAADTVALLDHLGWDEPVRLAGHSMGGWIAETLVLDHPARVRSAALMGSANAPTAWEVAITTVERDLARLDYDLPPLFYATETLRYLPIADIQDNEVVSTWLSMMGDLPAWPNPGRLGQYEAALAWSTDPARTTRWPEVRVPCLVLAFEHDVDSPPRYARLAAEAIPGCAYREVDRLGAHRHPHPCRRRWRRTLIEFFAHTERGTGGAASVPEAQVLVHGADAGRTLADGARHPLGGARAHVAHREQPGMARLERQREPVLGGPALVEVLGAQGAVRQDEAAAVERGAARDPVRGRVGPDEGEEPGAGDLGRPGRVGDLDRAEVAARRRAR